MLNLRDLDYTDSNILFEFAKETLLLADEYRKAREIYASAKSFLNRTLAEGYKDGTIDIKHSKEKAILLASANCIKVKGAYNAMVESEENYKGLEEVIKTRHNLISLAQTLSNLVR